MASYKETPRQKMIAMMYLVLTALLALNVSKEILTAFTIVNESLESTNTILNNKSEDLFIDFEKAYQLNQAKVKPFWDKAQTAKQLSNDMAKYIDHLKAELIAKTDGIPIEVADTISLKNVKKRDNYDVPTNYFIGQSQDGSRGKALELKIKIDRFKQQMLDLIDPKLRDQVKIGFETQGDYYDSDGARQNWEMHNFYHTILAADVTLLNKFIADVKNAEIDIVTRLFNSITAEDYKFDNVYAKAVPKSKYIILGDDFEADVFVTAYNTKSTPEVIGNFRKEVKGDGIVTIKMPTTKEGLQKFTGIVKLKGPTGDMLTLPIEDEFIVAKPSGTVAATYMNVFYIGVDNPVSISVPGVPDEKLQANISAGRIERLPAKDETGANFRVLGLPNSTNEVFISILANMDGKSKDMGKVRYRVKRLPDPTASIANKTQGLIEKQDMVYAGGIIAAPPAGFEFKTRFEIKSFEMVTVQNGDIKVLQSTTQTKGLLTPEMKSTITNSRKSQKFWFEKIVAVGPDGIERTLNSINLTVK